MKYYETLVNLAEIATEKSNGKNVYNIIDFAGGFVPFKNKENLAGEVGIDFITISRWLLDEIENQ